MIIRILLYVCLALAACARVHRCQWREAGAISSSLHYLLSYPQHGECGYSVSQPPSSTNQKLELNIFMRLKEIEDDSEFILTCGIGNNYAPASCQMNLISFGPLKKRDCITRTQIQQNSDNSSFKISFFKSVKCQQQPCFSQQSVTLKVINIEHISLRPESEAGTKTEFSDLVAEFKMYRILAYALTLGLALKQELIGAYSMVHIHVLVQVTCIFGQNLLSCLFRLVESQVYRISFAFSLGWFAVNSILIVLCTRSILSYLCDKPLAFNAPDVTEQPTADTLRVGPGQQQQPRNFFHRILQGWCRISAIYKSAHLVKNRSCWLSFTILNVAVMSSWSYLISVLANLLVYIVLPVYFCLRDVSSALPLKDDDDFQFRSGKKVAALNRDQLLLPVCKISSFFVANYIFISQHYDSVGYSSFRHVFQVCTVGVLWGATLAFVAEMIRDKAGKSVRLLKPRKVSWRAKLRKCLARSSVLASCCHWHTKQQREQSSQLMCCICLEQIKNTSEEQQKSMLVETECGHIFHLACFARWSQKKAICPMDRNYLNLADVAKILRHLQAN